MNLSRVDSHQRNSCSSSSSVSSSSLRRSSLVVNLSTKRSSISTIHNHKSSAKNLSSKSLIGFHCEPISQRSFNSTINHFGTGGFLSSQKSQRSCSTWSASSKNSPSHYVTCPQSAPPTLIKPSYSTSSSLSSSSTTKFITVNHEHDNSSNSSNNNNNNNLAQESQSMESPSQNQLTEKLSLIVADNSQVINKANNLSISEVGKDSPVVVEELSSLRSNHSSRRNSNSSSPEPIVEVKQSSSSSNNNSDSSNSGEDSSSSRRLIRRRTVRRYQRATTTERQEEPAVEVKRSTAEVSISVNKASESQSKVEQNEAKNHFRTRQIGSYYAQQQHQQQQASSTSNSSSKVAKCSVTTNRKLTTFSTESSSGSKNNKAAATSSLSSSSVKEQQQQQQQQQQMSSLSSSSSSSTNSGALRGSRPPLELRLKEQFKNSDLFDIESTKSSIQVEEEQESHHRESFSSTTSVKRAAAASDNLRKAAAAAAAISSSSSTSEKASTSRLSTLTNIHNDQDFTSATSSSSSSSRHFRTLTSSSVFLGANNKRADDEDATSAFALNPDSLFTSPDVRSLVREIGTDFAELENAVSTRGLSQSNSRSSCNSQICATGAGSGLGLSNRLFGRLLSPIESASINRGRISNSSSNSNLFDESLNSRSKGAIDDKTGNFSSNGDKIQDLLARAESFKIGSGTYAASLLDKRDSNDAKTSQLLSPSSPLSIDDKQQSALLTAGLSVSIEKIDQKMSDLCKKFDECNETKKAIELIKLMIQMIEKAWSVPVCGDDLGFRLCNSLRVAGGLDIILGFIQDADNLPPTDPYPSSTYQQQTDNEKQPFKNNNTQLRLNLSKVNDSESKNSTANQTPEVVSPPVGQQKSTAGKDSDSDAITSDLGLDSTSVESLSYVSAPEASSGSSPSTIKNNEIKEPEIETKQDDEQEEKKSDNLEQLDPEEASLRKEELVFLSAKLLSQCLTSDNRDYIVAIGLNSVIKLACQFTTMKSSQSQRLLSRSMIMRQSSSVARQVAEAELAKQNNSTSPKSIDKPLIKRINSKNGKNKEDSTTDDHSVVHAIIGTEILQHLFKHSEDTCSKMISLGALQAILYACRSSNVETLRHCASALANLALYGGPDIQQTMIESQAHHWLFPLAFNEDDNVQYYACLAIVVLAANQEIEADVQKSGTLDLVEPFVTLHEPQKFAESNTAHIHGQSASWLKKLMPLLESRRPEARSLACFHFAMEAYIKREQGQAKLFRDIGAVEILQRAGSSPVAIISKFSCQALRMIGEREPHRLSQHVPKWTCEDVLVWISQIGFEKYREAFASSHVDGDLLLQIDEEMLRLDIGIENGIIRRKFLRELSKLKQIADYSSVDKTNLSGLLKLSAGREFVEYIYLMIQLGVTSQNIHWLECEQLLRQCKVSNHIHQIKLAHAIKSLQAKMATQENMELSELGSGPGSHVGSLSNLELDPSRKKTLDVFISYRRSNGCQLASLLKVHLQLRHFSVFIDVERLEAGKFDNNLLDSIKSAKNFILVLSPNALDRCIGDRDCRDWVHKEIVAAIENKCNIIPIMDNFHWPDADELPEDMRSIHHYNGVRWIHDYQDACVDKIERFIRGELINGYAPSNSSAPSSLQRATTGNVNSMFSNVGGTNYTVTTPNIVASTPASTSSFVTNSSRIPAPPFDADHHPLSFAASHHYHQQHSQASSTPVSQSATQPPI